MCVHLCLRMKGDISQFTINGMLIRDVLANCKGSCLLSPNYVYPWRCLYHTSIVN